MDLLHRNFSGRYKGVKITCIPIIPVDYWQVLRGICSKAFSESISYFPLIRVLKLWSRTAKCPSTLWARIIKNPDVRTGLLGRSFACWLAPFTYYLAPHCSLNLRAMLSSLACSLAQPLNPELVGKWVMNAGLSGCSGPLCSI